MDEMLKGETKKIEGKAKEEFGKAVGDRSTEWGGKRSPSPLPLALKIRSPTRVAMQSLRDAALPAATLRRRS